MPINPNEVQWDETPQINAEQVQWDEPSTTAESPGIADYLKSLWEGYKGGASMALQAAAVPISGMAGLAKTITSGPEAGAQTIEQIQQAAAGIIPAKPAEEAIGKTIQAGLEIPGVRPVVETAMKAPETIGDLTYEGALGLGLSPDTAAYFGAAGKSAIPVAIELLSIPGTKAAKKTLLRRVIEKENKAGFYTEMGELSPEIKTALKNADIGLEEVSDFLPENITTQKAAQPLAEQIKAVPSKLGMGESVRAARLAETFQPNIEKIKAFEAMEMDYLPQYVSENPTAKAIAENLKDIPGSLMAAKEKQIVEQLSKRADDLIIEAGGTIDKGELSTRFMEKTKTIIDDLAESATKNYNAVGDQMPKNTPVETEKILSVLKKRADEVGGVKYLSAKEQSLLKTLDPETGPTYGRVDLIRRQVGEQLGGIDTPFRNVDRKSLGELYAALTDDQETALLRHGDQALLETYLTGKYLTAQRKGIETQLQALTGKKLTGDVTKKMGNAVRELATGNTRTFDDVLTNIPKVAGEEIRRDLVVSALNDAFTTGARSKGPISIGGFDGYWKKLNRNPQARNRLKTELGETAWNRLETLATVNNALKETMELSVRTGRQLSTPGLFDEVNSIAHRAYGEIKRTGRMVPGVGRLFDTVITAPKNARSIAADELLSDRKFQNLLKQQVTGKVDTAKKAANMNRLIENLKSYKKWKNTLSEADINDLTAVGAMGYFTGKTGNQEQQK
jgi:hypothetical protein